MVRMLKRKLYFLVAAYFRFFAAVRLRRWQPRIAVITGSNGKTTALHLVEAQLGRQARYSHGANSSFGIPFDILGLRRVSYSPLEWVTLGLAAPFAALKKPPQERMYVAEADCDRPGEGSFLARLLKPEACVWVSAARTHSMNFERVAREGGFPSVDDAIAREFGHLPRATTGLLVINADDARIVRETAAAKAPIVALRERERLQACEHAREGTTCTIDGVSYRLPFLVPKEAWYAIAAAAEIARYFGIPPKQDLSGATLPPGRSSVFRGLRNTTLIDSTYNCNLSSLSAILGLARSFSGEKWLVLGDLLEQGGKEKEEHEKAARMLPEQGFSRIILVGPRLREHALPLLPGAIAVDGPREALAYLTSNLRGGETILFKGARFLEGVVEALLADPADAAKLCRREEVWRKRRAAWGV